MIMDLWNSACCIGTHSVTWLTFKCCHNLIMAFCSLMCQVVFPCDHICIESDVLVCGIIERGKCHVSVIRKVCRWLFKSLAVTVSVPQKKYPLSTRSYQLCSILLQNLLLFYVIRCNVRQVLAMCHCGYIRKQFRCSFGRWSVTGKGSVCPMWEAAPEVKYNLFRKVGQTKLWIKLSCEH